MAEKKTDAAKRTGDNKTTPDAREFSDENTFAKEFLLYVDDSSKVSDEAHEANKNDTVQSALQRGLRATGEAKLVNSDVRDEHNVLCSYALPVEPNTLP